MWFVIGFSLGFNTVVGEGGSRTSTEPPDLIRKRPGPPRMLPDLVRSFTTRFPFTHRALEALGLKQNGYGNLVSGPAALTSCNGLYTITTTTTTSITTTESPDLIWKRPGPPRILPELLRKFTSLGGLGSAELPVLAK